MCKLDISCQCELDKFQDNLFIICWCCFPAYKISVGLQQEQIIPNIILQIYSIIGICHYYEAISKLDHSFIQDWSELTTADRVTATEQVQALPILGIICIPEVGFNAPLPITFLDLPPIDVIPNVLLVLVPLQRHVSHGIPWRHLQTTRNLAHFNLKYSENKIRNNKRVCKPVA